MDGAWLHRMRWRRRGAWLWPVFVAMIVVDALLGHALPPSGETQSAFAAGLLGIVLSLIALILLTRPLGALLRRVRPDLPAVVARDYAGTAVVLSVTLVLLLVGTLHRPSVLAHQRAMRDAIARAQAWIGDRAPVEFRRNLALVSTFAIEPGSVFRICVPSDRHPRSYCVVVEEHQPFDRSVSFAGYEPNSMFASGVN
jgi:membrane protease YdiL (CAAX protease family)